MSEHIAQISWSRDGREFTYDTYDRDHTWSFDGGVTVPASANPAFLGSPGPVDPEEAFVAALSSCHMLTFLAIAARKRLVVESYDDRAVGVMEKNAAGRLAVTRVILHPTITWGGPEPDPEQIEKVHHLAHEQCFIANSVTTEVTVAGDSGI
ncbi:OsmC family protein [Demetria terragena]|uniref:OsmC family protein n=1 Tax=Demetria terragena TaxID=63959 RepID=UPI00037F9696|nr:OsmC family protein [Demetria terragena]